MGFRNKRLCEAVHDSLLLTDKELVSVLKEQVQDPWAELAIFVEDELAINFGLKQCARCGTWSLDFHGEYCFDCRGE